MDSSGPASAAQATADERRRPLWALAWLAYLALYPVPWFVHRPSLMDLTGSAVGVALFLALYLHSLLTKPRWLLVHVAAIAVIGFCLSPFGGIWEVFNVYASSAAGRLASRRQKVIVLVGLQLSLIAFASLTGEPWYNWIWGVFFGVMTGFATSWQSEIEQKNRALEAAQVEVRAMAQIAERERIARDLHDLLGHTLTLVAVKAELAARLTERDVAAARREMEDVAAIARDALGEVRAAVAGMRGAALSVELDRAGQMLAAAKVEASLDAGPRPGDAEREAVLAMALREAVTNVIRHARASRCVISLGASPDGGFRLSVADDGRGGAIREGAGLSGMRARLAAAGGRLEVSSGAGGTRLTASLPARG